MGRVSLYSSRSTGPTLAIMSSRVNRLRPMTPSTLVPKLFPRTKPFFPLLTESADSVAVAKIPIFLT